MLNLALPSHNKIISTVFPKQTIIPPPPTPTTRLTKTIIVPRLLKDSKDGTSNRYNVHCWWILLAFLVCTHIFFCTVIVLPSRTGIPLFSWLQWERWYRHLWNFPLPVCPLTIPCYRSTRVHVLMGWSRVTGHLHVNGPVTQSLPMLSDKFHQLGTTRNNIHRLTGTSWIARLVCYISW